MTPREVLENCVRAAGTSPSGGNAEPWTYVVVGDLADTEISSFEWKQALRNVVEEEAGEVLHRKLTTENKEQIGQIGLSLLRPYFETAPYVVVVCVRL